MTGRRRWTRAELIVALALYCRLPFGQLHHRNSVIVRYARALERTPSALAMKLTNLASLDPAITGTGRRGLANASAQDRALWAEMRDDWEQFAIEAHAVLARLERPNALSDHPSQDARAGIKAEDRYALTKVRIGQAFFRDAVLSAYNGQCCITGLSAPSLLVASHIVPWRIAARHRLNPSNGLLLSALHDKAFDQGLLTIDEDWTVKISSRLAGSRDRFYGVSLDAFAGRPIALPEKFAPEPTFLAYHRENVFRP